MLKKKSRFEPHHHTLISSFDRVPLILLILGLDTKHMRLCYPTYAKHRYYLRRLATACL